MIFHAFSDHYSIVQFWRLRVTCFAQKYDFWTPVCAPLGPKLRPLGHPYRQKGPQRCSPPVGPWPLFADLGATSGPKRPRLPFHWFKGRFWNDFGLDFRPIWARFPSNLSYHQVSLVFLRPYWWRYSLEGFCMFHAVFWYSIYAFWYSIKAELYRQASRSILKVVTQGRLASSSWRKHLNCGQQLQRT